MSREREHWLAKKVEDERMQGIVTLYDEKEEFSGDKKMSERDQLTNYVTHFSQISDLLELTGKDGGGAAEIVRGLQKVISSQVQQNQVKVNLKNAIIANMTKIREKRTETEPGSPSKFKKLSETETLKRRQLVFNKSIDEETKQMSHIADQILSKKEYSMKFKEIQKYHD